MQLVKVKVGGKTHTIGKISAFASRELLKVQRETIAMAKQAQSLQENAGGLEAAEEVMDMLGTLSELRSRKAWLITEIFDNKFTVEDLEKELSDQEIETLTNQIMFAVNGVIQKN